MRQKKQALQAFDPQKFVQSLSVENLEFLAEFYDEAEAQLQLINQGSSKFKAPTGKDVLKVFQAAEYELMNRNLLISHSADDGPDRKMSAKEEWAQELGHEIPYATAVEVTDEEKSKKKREGLRLPAILRPDEIQALFTAAQQNRRNGRRNNLILRVLYASGVRRAELVNILVADLYLEQNTILIRSGKSDKDRYVLLDPQTTEEVRDYTSALSFDDKVFSLSERTINRIVEDAAERSGITARYQAMGRKITVHGLRHCFATHMYEAGADLFLLKTLLGHYNLKVTKMYVHIGVGLLGERYRQTHPLARGEDSTPHFYNSAGS